MQDERIDPLLLRLLSRTPGPWQIMELERDLGEPIPVQDAVARLVGAGLAHRIEGGFVFASAAGRCADSMGEERS